jgi:hypothetical protein
MGEPKLAIELLCYFPVLIIRIEMIPKVFSKLLARR